MSEAHLYEGNQSLDKGAELTYGQSITDVRIVWNDAEPLLRQLAHTVKARRKH